MNWDKLLNKVRLGEDIEIPYNEVQYAMSEFEKDYWRILDCSAFRRLQDKNPGFSFGQKRFCSHKTHSFS